jgi:rod shape-determining protein MreD
MNGEPIHQRALFEEDPIPLRTRLVPAATVMAGSLVTILPFVATLPILPPFGLLLLLGWRLHRPDALRVWAPLPLGFFDDLLSGQPLGSAILLWTLCFLMIELIDSRLVWRDFWQDWLIAVGGIVFCLVSGRFLAAPFVAPVDTMLVLQIATSVLLFPVISRMCTWIDRKRDTP